MSAESLRAALSEHQPEIRALPNGENGYECVFDGEHVEALTELVRQHLFHGTGLDRVRRLETGVEILGRSEFGVRLRVALSQGSGQTRFSVHQIHESSAEVWAGLMLGGIAAVVVTLASPLGLLLAALGLVMGWRWDKRQFRARVKALLLDVRVGLYERQRALQRS